MALVRDEELDRELRFRAATAAAPFVHPRLAVVDVKATIKKEAREMTREELLAIASQGATVIEHETPALPAPEDEMVH